MRIAAVVIFLIATWVGAPVRAERILNFVTEVALSREDEFGVTEKIRYDFGNLERHGIYRDIPVRYGRGHSPDYRISIAVEHVTNATGESYRFDLSRRGKYLRIRIGDPQRTVTGAHDYWITYRVRRGVLYFDDHDEIYWNATGNEWPVPIDRAEASVTFPAGVDHSKFAWACYTGPKGSVERACSARVQGRSLVFASERALEQREGLTVLVRLPKRVIREPSASEQLISRVGDYATVWLLIPLITLGAMVSLWWRTGRDPKGRTGIPIRYEPPAGMTPAEAGTVVDERVHIGDITSTILDLAVRGYLEIEEVESTSFLFLSSKDYQLKKLRNVDAKLKGHESMLMSRLFGLGNRVLVSSLRNRFYLELRDIKREIYTEVTRKGGYFPVSPERVRAVYTYVGAAIGGLGVLGWFVGALWVVPMISLAAAGGIIVGLGQVMPRKTRKGRQAHEAILGFKEFVSRVGTDLLEREGLLTTEGFEKILPYAIALGVADPWADAFADIYKEAPRWYHRLGGYSRGFYPRVFVDEVGRSLDTIGQTLGSSPGGGGGGFSGGGGGGGGGGSW